ncbi:MAG: suppressor of fused domain protein [Desulfobacterales bacterium]|nr:suppressor of fused domain protein [Desulfobacterales bacterium]
MVKMDKNRTFEEVWDERLNGMTRFFGEADNIVLHGTIPFYLGQEMGGSPDFVKFSNFTDGILYVTSELIGYEQQVPNTHGRYELAIVHPTDEEWGVNIICQLAYYTLETPIEDLETMGIGSATPEDSTIEGFLFRQIANFEFFGNSANVICCVGITGDELEFKHDHGSDALVERIGKNFYLTDLYRTSLLYPQI